MRNVWILPPEPSDERYCAACDTLYDGSASRRIRSENRDGQRVQVCSVCGSSERWVAHYAAYPREIPRRAIMAGSLEGGLVLDPFIGSGTTAIVARQLGRRCIGLDASCDYLRLAARRLERVPLPLEV